MEEVYDLQQFSCLIVIYVRKTKVCFDYYSTAAKITDANEESVSQDSCITYDKQKMNIKSWGYSESDDEDDVRIDNFLDELNRVFKKDKEEWNEDDLFLLKAVSDFIRLSVEEVMKTTKEKQLKSLDQLHYLFVVPSEWEEEIRENLLRSIFIQSKLISNIDHNDRLLFCSDLESIFYYEMKKKDIDFEKKRKTIFCRIIPFSENEMSIKLDLVSTVNRLFDVPDSSLFPKVECSNQLSLTINTFKEGARALMKDELPISIQEEIIQIIMDKEEDENDEDYIKKPLITDTSRWELDEGQRNYIRRICIFDICSQICKNTTNNIDVLLSNDIIKEYNLLLYVDSLSSGISPSRKLLNWSEHLLTYSRTYSRNKNIISYSSRRGIRPHNIMHGARIYCIDVIDNANIYSRPRILPVKNSANSSSIFLESKPDAIMNIDISIESTMLSFSLLDENGLVKEVWNHGDFLNDKSLCSLGSFFNFSETTTMLNIKFSFIEFAKDYLIGDNSFFSRRKKKVLLGFIKFTKDFLKGDISFLSGNKKKDLLKLNALNAETMLRKDKDPGNVLVSTQQQMYIEAFLLLYMTHIKYVILSKLSDIVDSNMEIKIGYDITAEKILLNRLFCSKEGLKDIIYASGLIQKDDNSKKLRIITEGERIMYLLQRSLALSFPLNSYFVLAQLRENYIQLTLNKVVTESSSDEEDQEAIIIHDRIIHIPNIYTSLCLNMWNNIVEDSSLIKLCHIHQEYSGNDLLEIFSLENQAEFTENLKQYISKDNLDYNSSQPATDEINIQLSVSCNCRVYLTVRDIIDISFQPVLQEIVSLVSASFINKELFGKFWNIQYLFQLIHFDYNSQLKDFLINILKETTDDVMIEQGVDIPHYVIPKSLNQLSHPVLHQQSISYKEFQVGTLHHVSGNRYGFGFSKNSINERLVYKNEATDTKNVSVSEEIVFPLFKKGDLINDLPMNLKFVLNSQEETKGIYLRINYFKLKMPCDLNSNGTVRFGDIQEKIIGSDFNDFPKELKIGQDIPILISVLYEAYSGSLILKTKLVAQDININWSQRLGAPMHLSRF